MADLDLTEAIKAARQANDLSWIDEIVSGPEGETIRVSLRIAIAVGVAAAAPIIERVAREQMTKRMLDLAAKLSVGWDLEPNPNPLYVAQGQAFQEAARRIRIEVADA